MMGVELIAATVTGGLGFAAADFADRYFATYDPSATGPAPTNKFTSPSGTLANTLNIAHAPSMVRIGVGLGMVALPGLGAAVVSSPMARSALQGATLGAAIRLFSNLWNGYVMAGLFKSSAETNVTTSLGARLYPAEITAALNSAPAGQAPSPGLGRQYHALGAPSAAALLNPGSTAALQQAAAAVSSQQAYGAYGQPIGPGTGGYGSEAPGSGGRALPPSAPTVPQYPSVPSAPTPPVGSTPNVPYPPPPSNGGNGYHPMPPVPSGVGCTNCGCQTGDCGCSCPPGLGDRHANGKTKFVDGNGRYLDAFGWGLWARTSDRDN